MVNWISTQQYIEKKDETYLPEKRCKTLSFLDKKKKTKKFSISKIFIFKQKTTHQYPILFCFDKTKKFSYYDRKEKTESRTKTYPIQIQHNWLPNYIRLDQIISLKLLWIIKKQEKKSRISLKRKELTDNISYQQMIPYFTSKICCQFNSSVPKNRSKISLCVYFYLIIRSNTTNTLGHLPTISLSSR